MREELRQQLAKQYHFAATKMQDSPQTARKAYYFSILYGDSQRFLNWEWDRDLALIYAVTFYTYNNIYALTQPPARGLFPIDEEMVFGSLTQAAFDLATYLEKTGDNTEELHQILGRFAEISYAATGNGSYLYEKGLIKF
jgi:hypothetical protein